MKTKAVLPLALELVLVFVVVVERMGLQLSRLMKAGGGVLTFSAREGSGLESGADMMRVACGERNDRKRTGSWTGGRAALLDVDGGGHVERARARCREQEQGGTVATRSVVNNASRPWGNGGSDRAHGPLFTRLQP